MTPEEIIARYLGRAGEPPSYHIQGAGLIIADLNRNGYAIVPPVADPASTVVQEDADGNLHIICTLNTGKTLSVFIPENVRDQIPRKGA